jgi:endonuclease/exonuclease/phosphatase family metal-dependent hydrolase
MRLMTYNILRGGRDGEDDARLAKVCTLIRSVNPDILVLNECNDFERDGFRTHYRVERELGMRGVLAPASTGFHVGLFLRRGQLMETHFLNRELHHAALAATVEHDGVRWVLVAAHLCPFGGDLRLGEVQQLSRFVRGDHVVVLGDLNALSPADAALCQTADWLPRRRVRHQLAASGGKLDTRAVSALEECGLIDVCQQAGAAAPTAQTRLLPGWESYQVRIDYVFGTPAFAQRVTHAARIDGDLADAASDHYPLVVDVDW